MYANGAFRNATDVLKNSFKSKLFITDFPYHSDFGSCLILSTIEYMLAHFLTISLFACLPKFSATLITHLFGFVPTYKCTYFLL